jgi:hypothetical protein
VRAAAAAARPAAAGTGTDGRAGAEWSPPLTGPEGHLYLHDDTSTGLGLDCAMTAA